MQPTVYSSTTQSAAIHTTTLMGEVKETESNICVVYTFTRMLQWMVRKMNLRESTGSVQVERRGMAELTIFSRALLSARKYLGNCPSSLTSTLSSGDRK